MKRSFTGSFSDSNCKNPFLVDLYNKLKKGYNYRQEAIKLCIVAQADQVKILRETRDKIRDADSHDIQIDKSFKAEQRKVSLSLLFASNIKA